MVESAQLVSMMWLGHEETNLNSAKTVIYWNRVRRISYSGLFFLFGGKKKKWSKHSIQILFYCKDSDSLLLQRLDPILKSLPALHLRSLFYWQVPTKGWRSSAPSLSELRMVTDRSKGHFQLTALHVPTHLHQCSEQALGWWVAVRVTLPETLPSAQLCCANPLSPEHTWDADSSFGYPHQGSGLLHSYALRPSKLQ